jgi:hypothetical protein
VRKRRKEEIRKTCVYCSFPSASTNHSTFTLSPHPRFPLSPPFSHFRIRRTLREEEEEAEEEGEAEKGGEAAEAAAEVEEEEEDEDAEEGEGEVR